jgi:hypothetical protein
MTTGKWAAPGVPQKGWRCIDIEDLGEASATCAMCEVVTIRYVHVMSHESYPDALRCGCVCAGHMAEDLDGAHNRERVFKARFAKRKNWLSRRWRLDDRAHDYVIVDGFRVSAWRNRNNNTYSAQVLHQSTGWVRDSKRRYETMDAAKLVAFDVMIGMQKKLELLPPAHRQLPAA